MLPTPLPVALLGLSLVAGCGSARRAAPATTDLAPSTPALGTPAPGPAPTRLVVRDAEVECEPIARCRLHVRSPSAALVVEALEADAVVEYAGRAGTAAPGLAELVRAVRSTGDPAAPFAIALPLVVRFSDGSRADGTIALDAATTMDKLGAELWEVSRHPLPLPDDDRAPAAPRAMWVVGGTAAPRVRGHATRLQDIDWVLVADDAARAVTCARGTRIAVSDTRARVFDRRSGAVVGQQIFPSGPSDRDACASGGTVVGMRSAQAAADWAWNELRRQLAAP